MGLPDAGYLARVFHCEPRGVARGLGCVHLRALTTGGSVPARPADGRSGPRAARAADAGAGGTCDEEGEVPRTTLLRYPSPWRRTGAAGSPSVPTDR